jgi:leucyl aminopeptidase
MVKFNFKNLKDKKGVVEVIVLKLDEKNNFTEFLSELKEKESEKIISELNSFSYKFANLNLETIKFDESLKICISINKLERENIRRAFSLVFKEVSNLKKERIFLNISENLEEFFLEIVEGIDLSDYDFYKRYKSKNLEENDFESIFYFPENFKQKNKNLLELRNVLVSVKFTRNLVNENSDTLTPIEFENIAKNFSKKNNLKIKILDEKKLKKEGLNLFYSVGKGAENPPRLIILEYLGDKNSKEKFALVGKGITFDTGGINLKPTGYLEDMRSDMGGAATVFGAFKAIVENKLKKNVICVLACAENAIGSKAYKPGDILKAYNGKFVEIGNTDAEGRLVLADAMSYVQKHYKVSNMIDVATLTGACLVALGPDLIAMLGNDKGMMEKLFQIGEKTYERVWELPIYEEHREAIKSKYADINNIGVGSMRRYGGTITAAAFLENFVGDGLKWVHLDIAGAARSDKNFYYISEFGTGRGVRLIYEFLKEY